MTRLEAIDALLVEVKAGEAYNGRWGMIKAVFSPDLESAVWFKDAWHKQSTDAAIALLRSSLPGLRLGRMQEEPSGRWYVKIYHPQGADWPKWDPYPEHEAASDTPARALLIAVLEAMKAKEEAA